MIDPKEKVIIAHPDAKSEMILAALRRAEEWDLAYGFVSGRVVVRRSTLVPRLMLYVLDPSAFPKWEPPSPFEWSSFDSRETEGSTA